MLLDVEGRIADVSRLLDKTELVADRLDLKKTALGVLGAEVIAKAESTCGGTR